MRYYYTSQCLFELAVHKHPPKDVKTLYNTKVICSVKVLYSAFVAPFGAKALCNVYWHFAVRKHLAVCTHLAVHMHKHYMNEYAPLKKEYCLPDEECRKKEQVFFHNFSLFRMKNT